MFLPKFGRGGCHIWSTHAYRLVRDRCDTHFELTGKEPIFWQYGRSLSAHARPLTQIKLSGDGTPWFQVPPLPSAEPRVLRVQAEDRADHHERGRGAKPAAVHLALVRPVRFLGGAGLLPLCVVGPASMDWPGRYLCGGPGKYGLARPLLVLWARPLWMGPAVTDFDRRVWTAVRRLARATRELCLGAAVIASVRGRAERK